MKIRGNPSHIAEKYISLARDSLSSGDIVMAENYLQHAEHYNRIIMAHREQTQATNERASANSQPRQAPPNRGGQSQDEGQEAGGPNADDSGGANGRAPARRGRQRPQARQQPNERQPRDREAREQEPREADNRERRPAQRQSRTRGPNDADQGNGEQPRPQSRPRRASNASNTGNEGDGSKITDGQDAPGFLRKPAAPARRRRKAPDAEPASPSDSVAAKDEA